MPKRTERDEDISDRPRIKKKLLEIFADVEEGFINQGQRTDDILDYWDCYNCKLTEKQYYTGNSRIFVPIVHNAINARKTRFVNQLFPKSGRYVDVIAENAEHPYAEMALAEHYIRKAKLKTEIAPALCVNGDVEGQMSLYVDWSSHARHVVWKETKPVEIDGMEYPDLEPMEDIEEDIIFDEHPCVEIIADADILILPVTADNVEQALADGGSVTIIRRWSKAKIQQLIDEKEIQESVGKQLKKEMDSVSRRQREDPKKKHADAAGIKDKGKIVLVYETWTNLTVDKETRLCTAYYGGQQRILGTKLCRFWNDRCPVITAPTDKVAGTFKGISKVKHCADMQYAANDAVNEGMDSAAYALLPIVMTDPLKNPRVGTMVMDLAAVWETNPTDTKFAQMPALWQDAFKIVAAAKQEVYETLGVNPSMVPQQTGRPGAKRNQAEIALEQQVDILTTADAVGVQEEGIWTPLVQRFMELDAQYRNEEITIRTFGQMGERARMEKIKPLQMGKRYEFVWFGVEQARSAAQIQQQISTIGTVMKIPPNLLPGRQFDLTVPVEHLISNAFGPRDAPLIFKDLRDQLASNPEIENDMLWEGFDVNVHAMDDDPKHIQSHMKAMQERGDPLGTYRVHIMKHQAQMAVKNQAQMMQQQSPQRGGLANRPGAQAGQARAPYQPPGAMHQDRMAGAGSPEMPRKT